MSKQSPSPARSEAGAGTERAADEPNAEIAALRAGDRVRWYTGLEGTVQRRGATFVGIQWDDRGLPLSFYSLETCERGLSVLVKS